MSVLYKTLRRMIERGQLNGMMDKLDIFFAADKLTKEEYEELVAMLPQDEPEEPVTEAEV